MQPAAQDLLRKIELQTAVLVRNLEMIRRRGDFYQEVDRSGYLILRTLSREGTMDIGSLSDKLGLDPSTVGRQVNSLEKSGKVIKRQDQQDLRRFLAEATSEGLEAMQKVRDRRLEGTAHLLQAWDEEEVTALETTLSHFNESIEQRFLRKKK